MEILHHFPEISNMREKRLHKSDFKVFWEIGNSKDLDLKKNSKIFVLICGFFKQLECYKH